MARVKSKEAIKHRKVLKQAKGFHSARSRRYKVAHEAVMHAGAYAFHGRKLKERFKKFMDCKTFSAKLLGTSYSKLINNLKKKN